jgi:hypothetical protein
MGDSLPDVDGGPAGWVGAFASGLPPNAFNPFRWYLFCRIGISHFTGLCGSGDCRLIILCCSAESVPTIWLFETGQFYWYWMVLNIGYWRRIIISSDHPFHQLLVTSRQLVERRVGFSSAGPAGSPDLKWNNIRRFSALILFEKQPGKWKQFSTRIKDMVDICQFVEEYLGIELAAAWTPVYQRRNRSRSKSLDFLVA